jgi:hypothetical protein
MYEVSKGLLFEKGVNDVVSCPFHRLGCDFDELLLSIPKKMQKSNTQKHPTSSVELGSESCLSFRPVCARSRCDTSRIGSDARKVDPWMPPETRTTHFKTAERCGLV